MDDTRILVVEDDADINEVVCERHRRIHPHGMGTGRQTRRASLNAGLAPASGGSDPVPERKDAGGTERHEFARFARVLGKNGSVVWQMPGPEGRGTAAAREDPVRGGCFDFLYTRRHCGNGRQFLIYKKPLLIGNGNHRWGGLTSSPGAMVADLVMRPCQ